VDKYHTKEKEALDMANSLMDIKYLNKKETKVHIGNPLMVIKKKSDRGAVFSIEKPKQKWIQPIGVK
jgi:hypothetical protein